MINIWRWHVGTVAGSGGQCGGSVSFWGGSGSSKKGLSTRKIFKKGWKTLITHVLWVYSILLYNHLSINNHLNCVKNLGYFIFSMVLVGSGSSHFFIRILIWIKGNDTDSTDLDPDPPHCGGDKILNCLLHPGYKS